VEDDVAQVAVEATAEEEAHAFPPQTLGLRFQSIPSRNEVVLEAVAVDEPPEAEAQAVPEAPKEAEAIAQTAEKGKLSRPTEIPISNKPIPMPKFQPGQDNTLPPEEEEWGPGLKGDMQGESGGDAPSFKKPRSKLTPYFKMKENMDKKE
jgi:hypothetical protein